MNTLPFLRFHQISMLLDTCVRQSGLREKAEKQTEETLSPAYPSSDDFYPQDNQETLYSIPENETYEDSNTGSLYTPLNQEPEYYSTNIDEYNEYTNEDKLSSITDTENEINRLTNQVELNSIDDEVKE